VTNSTTSYFRGETLLFTLSKHQRDFLADPPRQLTTQTDHHVRRRAAVLTQNGLISLSGDPEPQVTLTDGGRAAITFYDTLRGAPHVAGPNFAKDCVLDIQPLIARGVVGKPKE
jgi:hypothetical protein